MMYAMQRKRERERDRFYNFTIIIDRKRDRKIENQIFLI